MSGRPTRPRRALISVSDKTGVAELAGGLVDLGFELVSTGGTARALREAGLEVLEVSELTGFPEILDGRVKTLHPAIHGGLLARCGVDEATIEEHGIDWIDLLIVNLYPFETTILDPDCTEERAVEQIDVGGPAMLRAAAKNHARLTVVCDPADYSRVLAAFRNDYATTDLRRELAAKAFTHTARYDALISHYLRDHFTDPFPDTLVLAGSKTRELRYGENPHQRAAYYRLPATEATGIAAANQLQGKALTFNNLADADTAMQCVGAFRDCACVIVKHANPCGAAIAATPQAAYELAYETDPTSAFGGIIAFNRPLDADTTREIVARQLVDVVVAPSVPPPARDALAAKKNVRLLEAAYVPADRSKGWDLKGTAGGLLVQERDTGIPEDVELNIVTRRAPSTNEMQDLLFAWIVCKYVKSNAIVYAREGRTLGVGAGQMSRVVSARVAAMKAADQDLALAGAAMASDAFFPFRDGIDIAAEHGITCVIQPGGSVRDKEVIEAADEHDIAMVFTGMRHFRH
ncbi:MAG: bifunctional phosphoribosylaminoimidazolecarboxamide formyltransferase/IMP cyclohydrolase [Rhodospirillaceae bacterium]|nr:bifunctional phosphoribosylaminoimidazolecarboxamide formyltransferase/IMP cyclohydrolase [Rhodospirillaceae bacterium]